MKTELIQSFSKERLEFDISSLNQEMDKMRDMMRRLSQLTSNEVDVLKEEFEAFK